MQSKKQNVGKERSLKKKKKKKAKLNNFLLFVCIVSGVLYFSSVMLLKSHNLSLNYKIEELKAQNSEAAKELESLQVEVSRLEDRVNIQEFADTHGLKYDTDNIFYIHKDGDDTFVEGNVSSKPKDEDNNESDEDVNENETENNDSLIQEASEE